MSSTFPVYHGITLAENSYIENLHVEILTSDPSPVSAGRIWYNSTDKVFRQSTLNGSGAVVVRTFSTQEELLAEVTARTNADSTLQGNIDAEATARAAADTTLQANINAETTARSNADTTLQNNIDAEATARSDADTTLQSNINAEATTRANADTTLQNNINAESTARSDADTTLQSNIDAESTARAAADTSLQTQIDALGSAFNYVGTVAGGTEIAPFDLDTLAAGGKDAGDFYKVSASGFFVIGAGTAFFANQNDGLVWNTTGGIDVIDNTNSTVDGTASFIAVTGSTDTGFVVDIDSAFKTRVDTAESDILVEKTARSNADTTLQANIDAEATARSDADTTLQANINAEATARANADTTLQSNINAEATARSDADTTLQANIDAESTARVSADNAEATARANADTTLQANIDAEASARGAADTTLQANINAESTARTSADNTLQSNINTEITARTNADTTITNNIGDLTLLETTAKNSLVAAVNELEAKVGEGTEGVRDDYDATVFTYESGTPASTHVITHNLGSAFVDFGVMIQRADGYWYNDIASIQLDTIDPTNKATLYLSTALNVRVIARSAAKLGQVA